MKKIISMVLLLSMMLSFAACDSGSGSGDVTTVPSGETTDPTDITTDVTTEVTTDVTTEVTTDVTTADTGNTEEPDVNPLIESTETKYALGKATDTKETIDISALNKPFGVFIKETRYINAIELEFATAGTFTIAAYQWKNAVDKSRAEEPIFKQDVTVKAPGLVRIELDTLIPGGENYIGFENPSAGLSLVKAGKISEMSWREDNFSKPYGIVGNLMHTEYIYHDDSTVIYQLDRASDVQMMSYVIKTKNNKFIVIDGGTPEDTDNLMAFLKKATGMEVPEIEAWIITHAHGDHTGVYHILGTRNFEGIKINNVYYKITSKEFATEQKLGELATIKQVEAASAKLPEGTVKILKIGDNIKVDDVNFEIMYVPDDSITTNHINNASLMFMMTCDGKSEKVLFTGDMGAEQSDVILKMYPNGEFRADYVQMSHHGQAGATEEFYKATGLKGCLWPTPDWLWDSKNHKTRETRAWMDALGIKVHIKAFEGVYALKLK